MPLKFQKLFISFKEALGVFKDNKWDVKSTMVELEKLNQQYKPQQEEQREDEDIGRKKETAEKSKEQRILGLSEGEQEMFTCTMTSVTEGAKTEKESLPGKKNSVLYLLNFWCNLIIFLREMKM